MRVVPTALPGQYCWLRIPAASSTQSFRLCNSTLMRRPPSHRMRVGPASRQYAVDAKFDAGKGAEVKVLFNASNLVGTAHGDGISCTRSPMAPRC